MAVDLGGAPAETGEPAREYAGIVPVGRRLTLAETIDVDDRHYVRQPVERGELRGLPYRALGAFAVAEQAEHRGIDPVQSVRCSEAVGGRKALSERAGCDADPGIERGRMTLERAVDPAQRQRI